MISSLQKNKKKKLNKVVNTHTQRPAYAQRVKIQMVITKSPINIFVI